MTPTPQTILRDSALALPLFVALAAGVAGPWGALGAAVSGGVTLVNFAALAWLVDRLVRATAAGGGHGGVVLLLGKGVAALAAYGLLLTVFPPIAVALGLFAGLCGLGVRGTLQALHIPEPAASALPEES